METVGIVGMGNMGESIVRALLGAGKSTDEILFLEIKQERATAIEEKYLIAAAKDHEDLVKRSKFIVIAVKPQDATTTINALAPAITGPAIIVSIMAGITTSSIISMLGKPAKVVRIMPNICITVGEGALGVAPNYLLSRNELEAVEALLRPLGRIVEVGEEQMDAVTALGGSGPAFVLSFLQAMIDGGVKMGLARDKAHKIAVQTIRGTMAMLEAESLHPSLMKEMITSPGGTTIAGLVILDEKGFSGNVVRALEAAQARAKELSK